MNINNIKVVANNSRNPFPLEQQIVDSAKPGLCQVVYYRHTLPDSHYQIDVGSIMETTTLNTNAFVRGSQNIEFFFVPYSQIYGDFPRFYAGKGEHVRNPNLADVGADSLPRLQLGAYMKELFWLWLIGRSLNPELDYTGQNFRVVSWNPDTFVPDGYSYNIFGRPVISDILRLLDACGFGNLENVFRHAYEAFVLPLFAGKTAAELQRYLASPAAFEERMGEAGQQIIAILPSYIENYDQFTGDYVDWLNLVAGYSWIRISSEGDVDYPRKLFSVWPLAAYHKIWNDYYRNKVYDDGDYYKVFNFDWISYGGYYDLSQGIPNIFWMLVTPRFHQWKKDVYTGNFPSAQFGDVAFQQVSDGSLTAHFSDGSTSSIGSFDSARYPVFDSNAPVTDSSLNFTFDGVGISATDIRYTMALQRYRERLLRTGNRLKDIQKGIFGDSSRFVEDDYSVMLGAFRGSFEINKVAATNETSQVTIGQLGAYGSGSLTGRKIDFNCHDHGIIVGIYYFLPETEYNSSMIDVFNTKLTSDDFFKPDFENLGLSPVHGFELEASLGSKVLGYAARYHEYKTSVDLVRGVFGSYHLGGEKNSLQIYQPFADYVSPRNAALMRSNDLARFYVDPECMNSIFKVGVDSQFRDTDCFKLAMFFNVKAVQPMSVVGLPQL